MPQFEIGTLIQIGTMVVTVSGVVFALRAAVAKLETGQAEVLRQLGALHKRIDHYGERLSGQEINTARLEERIRSLRQTAKFRLTETD